MKRTTALGASSTMTLCLLAALALSGEPPPKVGSQTLVDKLLRHVKSTGVYPNREELVGRTDILPLLTTRLAKHEPDVREDLVSNALAVGADPRDTQDRWLLCPELASFLVHVVLTDKDEDVRNRAAKALVEHFPDSYLRSHSREIVRIAKKHSTDWDIYLLGKTGAVEARKLLFTDRHFKSVSLHKYEATLAKLGDTKLVDKFVKAYQEERNPLRKARAAWDLGYIGTPACVVVLAKDMRTPLVVRLPSRGERALRVDIAKALGMVYPEEPCFWISRVEPPEDDKWYTSIEKWLERRFQIEWKRKRPAFLFEIQGPVRRPKS